MSCFHGADPKTCFLCGVIRAQALGRVVPPMKERTLLETVSETLAKWVFFWRPKTGIDLRDLYKQEAQRVALADGLISLDELKQEQDKEKAADALGIGDLSELDS